ATWPVTRSIISHGPRCHTQCSFAEVSPGSASLIRRTRLTTKLRSVTSWDSPVVHSFAEPSTISARIFNSFSPVAAPAGSPAFELCTCFTPPRKTVCTLWPVAEACETQLTETTAANTNAKNFRRMCMTAPLLTPRCLDGPSHAEGSGLVQMRGENLHAHGQPRRGCAAGHSHAADAGQACSYRINIRQIHGERVAGLFTQFESRCRRCRRHNCVHVGKGTQKLLRQQTPHLLRF